MFFQVAFCCIGLPEIFLGIAFGTSRFIHTLTQLDSAIKASSSSVVSQPMQASVML